MPATLVPAPRELTPRPGPGCALGPDLRVEAPDCLAPLVPPFLDLLRDFAGIDAAHAPVRPSVDEETDGVVVRLALRENRPEPTPDPRHPGGLPAGAEAYELSVDSGGVRITADHAAGVFRGLSALVQLAMTAPTVHEARLVEAMDVLDAPTRSWRGLSLDTVRSFWPADKVRKILDLLALYRFDVLHIHLSDDEGWRIEIPGKPELTEVGGQGALGDRPGGHYTRADWEGILAHAAARHITVVPEIDIPGHTVAMRKAAPHLKAMQVVTGTEFSDPLDPTDPATLTYVQEIFTELAAMTPGPFVHIGGDEAVGMPHEEYVAFVDAVAATVRATGKRVVGWQEAARSAMGPGDLAQVWIAPALLADMQEQLDAVREGRALPEADLEGGDPEDYTQFMEAFAVSAGDLDLALDKGADIVLSPNPHAYLDIRYSQESADPAQAGRRDAVGAPFYGRATLAEFWDWDPGTYHPGLTAERTAGIEGAIWCECIETFEDLMFMVLPRLTGLAEHGWSGRPEGGFEEYAARVATHAPAWRRAGFDFFVSPEIPWVPDTPTTGA